LKMMVDVSFLTSSLMRLVNCHYLAKQPRVDILDLNHTLKLRVLQVRLNSQVVMRWFDVQGKTEIITRVGGGFGHDGRSGAVSLC
jgi:hypothetical protein